MYQKHPEDQGRGTTEDLLAGLKLIFLLPLHWQTSEFMLAVTQQIFTEHLYWVKTVFFFAIVTIYIPRAGGGPQTIKK